MIYKIRIEKEALKALKKINQPFRGKIVQAIEDLRQDPGKGDLLKGQWRGLWRLRVANYRIIYAIKKKELVILILTIGHRKDVYR